jgi:hypothetical protein
MLYGHKSPLLDPIPKQQTASLRFNPCYALTAPSPHDFGSKPHEHCFGANDLDLGVIQDSLCPPD